MRWEVTHRDIIGFVVGIDVYWESVMGQVKGLIIIIALESDSTVDGGGLRTFAYSVPPPNRTPPSARTHSPWLSLVPHAPELPRSSKVA